MMKSMETVLRSKGLGPTKTRVNVNGTRTLTWHVDDDDDRFVELTSSVRSKDFLLVCRDGDAAEAVVLESQVSILTWIIDRVNRLAGRRTGKSHG